MPEVEESERERCPCTLLHRAKATTTRTLRTHSFFFLSRAHEYIFLAAALLSRSLFPALFIYALSCFFSPSAREPRDRRMWVIASNQGRLSACRYLYIYIRAALKTDGGIEE